MKKYGKTIKRIGMLFLIALLAEICVFNFRSIQSWGNEPISYTEFDYYVTGLRPSANEGEYYLEEGEESWIILPDVNQHVENINFDMEIPTAVDLPFVENGVAILEISVTDEGYAMPYEVATRKVIPGISESHFVAMQSFGEVSSIAVKVELTSGYTIRISDIIVNAVRPISFHPVRFGIILSLLLLGYAFRFSGILWKTDCNIDKPWKKAAIVLLLGSFSVLMWLGLSSNPLYEFSTSVYPYRELAEAFASGQVSLLEQPAPELMSMDNPYDYLSREAMGVPYKWDTAYYDGKYYAYYGVLPCLLFYYPMYAMTGLHMPTPLVLEVCTIAFGIGIFLLLKEWILRFFPKTPYAVLLMFTAVALFSCQLPFFANQPEDYMVPILMGMTLTVFGLLFWIKSMRKDKKGLRGGMLILGSFCMALVAACRPNMILYSFLAIPLFFDYLKVKEGEYTAKNRASALGLSLSPYVLVAGCLMYYNAIRFGSPLEFGASYNLTAVNASQTIWSLDKMFLGGFCYLFEVPELIPEFPFIRFREAADTVLKHCYIYREQMPGGFFILHPMAWFALGSLFLKRNAKEKETIVFSLWALLLALVCMLITEQMGGIVYRYTADFSFVIMLVASLVALIFCQRTENTQAYTVVCKGIMILTVLSVIGGLLLLGAENLKFPLRVGNTKLYYELFYAFHPF